jgi:hypothetical protein
MPGAIASLKNSTSTVCLIGSAGGFNAAWGNVYYASIRKAIGGSVDQAVDFSSFTKLATTGTDSIGATWTNNVPTAAFFKWPRDLTQGTESAQPLLVSSAAVFDGRNDVIFSRYYLPQPYTRYAVLKINAALANAQLMSGGTGTSTLITNGTAGRWTVAAGTSLNDNSGSQAGVGVRDILSNVMNGTTSTNRHLRSTTSRGNAGTGTAGGAALGATVAGGAAAQCSFDYVAIFSVAHEGPTIDQVCQWLSNEFSMGL